MARLLICGEGSRSVPPLFPSLGQPSKPACPHAPRDSCCVGAVTSSPPGRRPLPAPSQPEIKPSCLSLPSEGLLRHLHSTCCGVGFLQATRASGSVGVGAEHAAGRRGRGEGGRKGFQRGAGSEGGLGHVPGVFSSARARQQCSRPPVTPGSRLVANALASAPDGAGTGPEHTPGATAGRCSWFQQFNMITATKPARHICPQNVRSCSRAMVGREAQQVFSARARWGQPGSAAPGALAAASPVRGKIARPNLLCNKRFLNASQILQHQIKTN